ncbi:Rho guanine nucleotide exchange factor 2 [Carabus blaptoides fortunei]
MDKNTADISERPKSVFSQCSMRRPTIVGPGMAGRPATLMDAPSIAHGQVLKVIVNRDDKGYGMKVSGDKPVYVQSVKEGGAAEKAGLHADDKIIQVNGHDVMESTHTEVVALIRSSNQVVLTVQQKPRAMGSPSLHIRALPMPSSTRITGPKPADNEKLRQFQKERVQTFRLMLEEEQRYVDSLRSELARCPGDEKKLAELTNAERRVTTLQDQLQAIITGQNEPALNHTHHRTKSSPDPISIASPGDSSRRLVASESLNDLSLSTEGWDLIATPPGTPPPPYPSPLAHKRHASSNRNSANTEDGDSICEVGVMESPEVSPLRGGGSASVLATSSPIVAASTNTTQQPIISMEDDEISDQEVMEDHGPFKSLSRLWEHTPHLAVFMNYVLSNSDPSSLLFYLLTDLYKEGNAKDMRKWAYEIHSSFLVPGAPLRLSNVDENIAREIDEVLLKEWDKEEILRKIFWKARNRAKEELNEQLADFQQKRTAGLGTIFGPPDAKLDEISHDKAKEMKLYESLLLNKLDPFLEELEKETADQRKCITAAALATVITKVFGVRGTHTTHTALDRCPTFISKDKSFRTKLIGKYSRKLNVSGHHYVAQHYFTVLSCNNCHQIIYGIGPQGYQCSVCLINLHRQCVKQYDDSCPGPINKKDRGIGKFMERIRPESKDSRRKPSAYFISMEREKRLTEEKDNVPDPEQYPCDRQPGQPVSRSSSDKRPDAVTEEVSRAPDGHDADTDADVSHDNVHNVQRAKSSQPAINRSESYKEQSQKRRQNRERRKISDPNLSKSNDVDSDHQELSYHSGSSSNSSLSSSRSSDSPQSLDPATHHHHPHGTTSTTTATTTTNWDSDVDIEPDPPDWQSSVSEEILSRLHPEEKKRQEIINELFHTERSHVRNLKVLETVFYRPLLHSKCLPKDQIDLLFSNLEDMLEIHGVFNAAMKVRRKEEAVIGDIGELLLHMFDGPAGEDFQQAAAKFCARQQLALESLKERRRKDQRLNGFLTDCESDKLCKRLQLKDIIPTGMQRLVKYPLLFESLAKCTERVLDSTMTESLPLSSPSSTPSVPQVGPTHTELARLKRAVERSKEILNFVNQAVKEADDNARLHDMQKRLDKSGFERVDHPIAVEFRNVDLTKHKLIHEGPLQWRLNKQMKLSVHVVLLEEVILLLQKQDEKYILKFYSSVGLIHSPIVKVSTVLVRHNATEKESLYLVNTSQNGAQIYDLCAQSPLECKQWFKHISDAAEAYKSREGKSRRSEVSTPEPEGVETSTSDLTTNGDGDKTDLMSGGDNASAGDTQSNADTDSNAPSGESSQRNSSVIEDEAEKRLSQAEPENAASGTDGNGAVGNSKREAQMRLATEDQPLIQPSEVTVNVLPVHTAQPVITPIEQVRRKDEAIRQALAEKEALVAEILHVPPEDYHTIVDMAGDISGDKEPTELVLAAINKANQLWSMVSDSLNVSDADTVLATSSHTPSCTSSPPKNHLGVLPSIPTHSVQHIASALNTHLTELLKVVKEREDEKERMRRELQKLREQLHVMHDAQVKSSGSLCSDAACTDTEIFHSAGDLANIEVYNRVMDYIFIHIYVLYCLIYFTGRSVG